VLNHLEEVVTKPEQEARQQREGMSARLAQPAFRADSLWIYGVTAVSEPGNYIGWVDCPQGIA
jgi:hypothetical protein